VNDEHLRERMRHAGRARASTFTWERTARATLAVYQQVVRR
jgi:glycosyltransferase involved in cell wall biosynthesis